MDGRSAQADGVVRAAILSADRVYRTRLTRVWDASLKPFIVCGLNPSTADGEIDDQTIRQEMFFARREGFGSLWKVNLYSFRATHPVDLWRGRDPIGPDNHREIAQALNMAADMDVPFVAAWGTLPMDAWRRAHSVLEGAQKLGVRTVSFGRTAGGFPRHPSRMAHTTALEPYP